MDERSDTNHEGFGKNMLSLKILGHSRYPMPNFFFGEGSSEKRWGSNVQSIPYLHDHEFGRKPFFYVRCDGTWKVGILKDLWLEEPYGCCFPKIWENPPNHPFVHRGFPIFSPSILGVKSPYFRKHPYGMMDSELLLGNV